MENFRQVNSINEAINLGYKNIIAWRGHYRGNGKGEVYLNIENYRHVVVDDNDDRGIYKMVATNCDVENLVSIKTRLVSLLRYFEFAQSEASKLFNGERTVFKGSKMVFGLWRKVYKKEIVVGCSLFSKGMHNKKIQWIKSKLNEFSEVSSTMLIYK